MTDLQQVDGFIMCERAVLAALVARAHGDLHKTIITRIQGKYALTSADRRPRRYEMIKYYHYLAAFE